MALLETIYGLLKLAIEGSASEVHIQSIKPAQLRLIRRLESVETAQGHLPQ
jgi:hypothetical protein